MAQNHRRTWRLYDSAILVQSLSQNKALQICGTTIALPYGKMQRHEQTTEPFKELNQTS